MSMNPPRPPDPLATRAAKVARSALHGQEVVIGILIGVALTLLIQLVR